jgi:hypothetical protein
VALLEEGLGIGPTQTIYVGEIDPNKVETIKDLAKMVGTLCSLLVTQRMIDTLDIEHLLKD